MFFVSLLQRLGLRLDAAPRSPGSLSLQSRPKPVTQRPTRPAASLCAGRGREAIRNGGITTKPSAMPRPGDAQQGSSAAASSPVTMHCQVLRGDPL